MDYMSVDGGSFMATEILAGTVVATGINGLEVKVACDDSYKTVNTNSDGYEAYVFNGTYLNGMTGITGNANPVAENGFPVTYFEDYGNAVPARGCAYTFTAPGNDPNKLVGYFYACGKLLTNKHYWVTEDTYAIGYEIDMVVNGKAEHFEVSGDPNNRGRLSEEGIKAQFMYLPPSIQEAGGWTSTPSLDQMRGYERGEWLDESGVSYRGMGYIKFPVYEGMTYYFGASGSKLMFSAFYLSSGDEEVEVYLRDNDGDLDDLNLSEEKVISVPDYGVVDCSSMSSWNPIELSAGTVVATGSNGLEVKVACEDEYKSSPIGIYGYDTYVFNGTELFGGTGIKGTMNPITAEGYPPTYFACYSNAVPVSGCAYTFSVPGTASNNLVGYFYACGYFSAEKQYFVTECNAAVGYEVNVLMDGSVRHFEVSGDSGNFNRLSPAVINEQFPSIPPSVQEMGGWSSTPSLGQMQGMDSWPRSGMGYIKFPVYEGLTYYFGATGDQFCFSTFYLSSGDEEVNVVLRSSTGEIGDLNLSDEGAIAPIPGDFPADYGVVDYVSVDGGTETFTLLQAGTVVAIGNNKRVEVKVAFDDSYRSIYANTDGYDTYVFNDADLFIENSIQGYSNPLKVDGYPPTYLENTYDGDAVLGSGCAYTFTVPGNNWGNFAGYFYACGRLTLNKAYWVTETVIDANNYYYPIGYEIDMVKDGRIEHFAVMGDELGFLSMEEINAQFTNLPPSVEAMGGWVSIPSLDEMRGYDRGTWPGAEDGMGYIKFPVYEGMTYYFGVAGSKYPFSAFYLSSGNERVTVLLRDSTGDLADLLLSGEEPTSITPHDAMEVVQEEYYTVSGIRVPALVPGLNLVRQILSDGSARTVKVVR